jgi:hypothetical protein
MKMTVKEQCVPDSGTEPVRDHVGDGLRASAAHIWLMIRMLQGESWRALASLTEQQF